MGRAGSRKSLRDCGDVRSCGSGDFIASEKVHASNSFRSYKCLHLAAEPDRSCEKRSLPSPESSGVHCLYDSLKSDRAALFASQPIGANGDTQSIAAWRSRISRCRKSDEKGTLTVALPGTAHSTLPDVAGLSPLSLHHNISRRLEPVLRPQVVQGTRHPTVPSTQIASWQI